MTVGEDCWLYDGRVTVQLFPRAWSTTLSSNMSSTQKKDGAWFSAWQPSQDTLSLTVRQPSIQAQKTTIITLQKWLGDQTRLTFRWTERQMNYQCVIKSVPTQLKYDAVMVDISLTLQLLTNEFMTSARGYTLTTGIENMLYADLVTQTTDDFVFSDDKHEVGSIATDAIAQRKQWNGWNATYNSDGTATFVKAGGRFNIGGVIHKQYRVRITDAFVKAMNGGFDLESILRQYASS